MLATAGRGRQTWFDPGVLHSPDDTLVECSTYMCGDFLVVGGFVCVAVGG